MARHSPEELPGEERREKVRASLQVEYKTPVNLAFTPDGREVFVACESSGTVIVVDAATRQRTAEIVVGGHTHDVAMSPDGRQAYVSNRLDDSVSVIDVATKKVTRTIPVGDEPHGLLTDRAGRRSSSRTPPATSISVIDIESGEEKRRLDASRNPWSVALSPDGESLLVSNALSRFVEFRTPSMSEITVVGAREGRISDRWVVPETNLLMGVAWHPSGEFALVTLNRTKNLVPMTRILQGWTITNGIGLLWADGRVDQVLLDEPNLYFADVADVAFSPDGATALVTSSGTDRVAVIDVEKLLALVEAGHRRGAPGGAAQPPRASRWSSWWPTCRRRTAPAGSPTLPTAGPPGWPTPSTTRSPSSTWSGGSRWRGSTWAGRRWSPTSAGESSSSTAPTSPSSGSSPATPATPTATWTGSPTTSSPTASGSARSTTGPCAASTTPTPSSGRGRT